MGQGERDRRPGTRSVPLSDALRRLTGGDSAAEAIEQRRCLRPPLGCGKQLNPATYSFRDRLSRDEYLITGLCQECQDAMEKE